MKLNLSSKNEYNFYPDIQDNLKKEEKDRFTIVVKKVNTALVGTDWFKYDKDNNFLGVNNLNKLKSQIREIKNAPIIEIDGKDSRELTIDDLLSDSFPELFNIVSDLNSFVLKLDGTGEVETKKS